MWANTPKTLDFSTLYTMIDHKSLAMQILTTGRYGMHRHLMCVDKVRGVPRRRSDTSQPRHDRNQHESACSPCMAHNTATTFWNSDWGKACSYLWKVVIGLNKGCGSFAFDAKARFFNRIADWRGAHAARMRGDIDTTRGYPVSARRYEPALGSDSSIQVPVDFAG